MNTSRTPFLRITGVTKRFGAVEALRGVDLVAYAGEAIALLGDNGAGKSTLVKIIAGNLVPDTGDIQIDGVSVLPLTPARSRALGIETVYQDLSLCPNLDVVANFFMGRERMRRRFGVPLLDEKTMAGETAEALERIGAKVPSVRASVGQLSGGQRQAIELARFIHWGGRLVILDEPFAALGVEQTRRGLELIQRVRERGIAVVVVTHNMAHAFRVADRIVVLRQGRVVSDRPAGETTAEGAIAAINGVASNP